MNKLSNLKIQRTLKGAREKQKIIHKRLYIGYQPTFQQRHYRLKREKRTFKVRNEKTCHLGCFIPASLSFRIEEEIKSLPFKQKLKEYIITILALQEMLKVLL